jgi:Sel1 repeat
MTRSARGTERGLLPRNDERPPWFALSVSLYKSDLLFRSLIDLSAAGLAVLAFTGALNTALQPASRLTRSALEQLTRPTHVLRTDGTTHFTIADDGPGRETILGVAAPGIADTVIQRASPDGAAALGQARTHLLSHKPELALRVLEAADESDPAILFGKAVATLHLGGNGRAIEAQRLLRGATRQAFAPAFTLNGLVLYRLLALHERGDLPANERLSLDGAGRPVPATPAQLAGEAVLWWQRGSAFHDAEAMRLLGMAEARGFNGKRNLAAAVVYWRDAAARGDALARLELGKLYNEGIGVEAGSDKAIELFRQAADQGVIRASIWLGLALVPKSMVGDVDAAREGMRTFEFVAKKSPNPEERTLAHSMLGVYLTEVAPASLRDPARAVDHLRFAARGGDQRALGLLARAFETGVGVDRDLVRAAGYLTLLRNVDKKAEADLQRVSQGLTQDERERAKNFRLPHDRISPDFLKEWEVRQQLPAQFGAVSSSLRPRSP